MTASAILGVFVALGAVLALLVLALKALQRFAPQAGAGRARVPLEVVQRLPLGPKQGVALVRVGDRVLALSTGEGGVRPLAELEGADRAAVLSAPPARPMVQVSSPRAAAAMQALTGGRGLGTLLGRRRAAEAAALAAAVAAPVAPPATPDHATPDVAATTDAPPATPARAGLGIAFSGATRLATLLAAGLALALPGAARAQAPAVTPPPAQTTAQPAAPTAAPTAAAPAALPAPLPALAPLPAGTQQALVQAAARQAGAARPAGTAAAPLPTSPAGIAQAEALRQAALRQAALRQVQAAGAARVGAGAPGAGAPNAAAAAQPPAAATGGTVANPTGARPLPAGPSTTPRPAPTVPTPVAPAVDTMVARLAPTMDLRVGAPGQDGGLRLSGTVGVVVMMGLMTLLPTLILMMTGFTRILVVLQFLKQAIGAQSAPPNQLVGALALLLTGFVMTPTLREVHRDALKPWLDGRIEQVEMLERGSKPLREFMLRQTRERDLQTFVELSQPETPPRTVDDVPLVVVMSAFVTSELRTAFQLGFALFLPFIVIDIVVSAVLMSMGMMMLPPAMIALPFKLLLFVLVDGWTLVIQSLVQSFR